MYSENYTTLKKEIQEDTNKWEHVPRSWIGKINIIKMAILPKAIYIFNAIPIKVPNDIFHRYRTNTSKIFMEPQMALNSCCSFQKEEQSKRNHNAWYQAVLEATVIWTAWYWQKNRHIDQWNRIESPEINWNLYGQLIINKGERSIKWSKNSLFNKWCWKSWTATSNKWNSIINLHHTKNKFKLNKRLKYK